MDPHAEARACWNTNEALLQGYRAVFVLSQSILLTCGGVLYEKSNALLLFLAILAIVMIGWIWLPLIRARHLVVDYYKYQASLSNDEFKRSREQYPLEAYLRSAARRRLFNAAFNVKKNFRLTRIKLDLCLPAMFLGLWICLFCLAWPEGSHAIKAWFDGLMPRP